MKVSHVWMGLVAVLTAAPVLAQGTAGRLPGGAFIYCPQSPDFCSKELNPLKSVLASALVTPIIQAAVMPTDLSPYATVFIVLPTPLMSQAQINTLNKFRYRAAPAKPGRIVVLGDPEPLLNKMDITFSGNDLLARLGVPMTMIPGVLPQAGETCPVKSENIISDPLTKGMSAFSYDGAGSMAIYGGAKPLLAGNLGLGAIIGGVWPGYNREKRNDVVAIFDGNIFGSTKDCDTATLNNDFWINLIH